MMEIYEIIKELQCRGIYEDLDIYKTLEFVYKDSGAVLWESVDEGIVINCIEHYIQEKNNIVGEIA